ncbi:MAG: beta-1,3-glucanase family protein [Chlamydiae bacterium]|nr:beta-1,3-glucanase family protein [Chlamydiota bacterium]
MVFWKSSLIRNWAAVFLLLPFAEGISLDPAPMQNYCPMVIVNSTGQPASKVYFVVHGNDLNGIPCFIVPDKTTGICSFQYPSPTGSPSSIDVSVTLSELPVATNTTYSSDAYLIYVPANSASRGYFSINNPMYLATALNPALGVIGVTDASVTTYSDPNFYTVYQDFEFGLVNTNKNQDSSLGLYCNLSWVDYFCLPMQLYTYSYSTSGSTPIVLDPIALPAGTIASMSRATLLTNVQGKLTGTGIPTSWEHLSVPFYSNPYTDTTPATTVRILAAKNSIALGTSSNRFTGGAVSLTWFDPTYATSNSTGPSTGKSFMKEVYDYYKTHTFYTRIVPADVSGVTVYSITSDLTTDLTLKFTGVDSSGASIGPNYTLLLGNSPYNNGGLTTEKLFSGSGPDWLFTYTGQGTDSIAYPNELAKVVSALFSIGYWPYPSATGYTTTGICDVQLSPNPSCLPSGPTCPFLTANCGFWYLLYFQNPNNFASGLWYNLYDYAMHQYMISSSTNSPSCTNGCVPTNPSLGLGYAYDYDDLLNMSGLIGGIATQDLYGNPSESVNAVQPYAAIVLGTVETSTIPVLNANSYNYQVTVGAAPGGATVTFTYYNAGGIKQTTVASTTATTSLGQVYVTPSQPFEVEFSFESSDVNYPYNYHSTFSMDLQHQIAVPTGTVFTGSDLSYQTGIVFSITGGTTANPQFTLNFNSQPPAWPG